MFNSAEEVFSSFVMRSEKSLIKHEHNKFPLKIFRNFVERKLEWLQWQCVGAVHIASVKALEAIKLHNVTTADFINR